MILGDCTGPVMVQSVTGCIGSPTSTRVGVCEPANVTSASGAAVGIEPVQRACTPAGGDPEADGDALGEGDGDAIAEAVALGGLVAPACGGAPQPASRKAPTNRAGILMPV